MIPNHDIKKNDSIQWVGEDGEELELKVWQVFGNTIIAAISPPEIFPGADREWEWGVFISISPANLQKQTINMVDSSENWKQ
jgi:hypothetical protein